MVAYRLVKQVWLGNREGDRVLGFRMWRMQHEHTLND